jgi:hypothetical protein
VLRVEMKQWGWRIEIHLLPGGAIAEPCQAVRPRVEKRDSGSAPVHGGGIEVLHAPQHLYSPMTKRSAEHAVAGQENSLEIARDESASRCLLRETGVLDAHNRLAMEQIQISKI